VKCPYKYRFQTIVAGVFGFLVLISWKLDAVIRTFLAAFHRVFSAWPLVRNSSSSSTEEGIFVTKSRKLSGDRDSFSIVVVRLIYLSDENVIEKWNQSLKNATKHLTN
jgi:hypothetical protein